MHHLPQLIEGLAGLGAGACLVAWLLGMIGMTVQLWTDGESEVPTKLALTGFMGFMIFALLIGVTMAAVGAHT